MQLRRTLGNESPLPRRPGRDSDILPALLTWQLFFS
jgi:hypothetical protein